MVVQQASFWQNSGQRRLRAIGIIGLTLLALACASCGPGSSNVAPRSQTTAPPGRSRFSQPVHLRIPALGVDAAILPVGQDRYGAMEAPGAEHPASDPIWGSAYWWKYGAVPGQAGNAVLAGHVDRNDGSRAVFWNLRQLQVGDQIIINEQDGQTLTFQVTQVASFANPDGGPSDPVIQRVFGPASSANLNLITCSGSWIGTEFNQRLVIFSTLVSGA